MRIDFTTLRNGHAKHPPMRSFKELCSEFGLSSIEMVHLMERFPNHPKPVFKHASNTCYNTWYRPVEFRRWFNSIPKEKLKHFKHKCIEGVK